MKQSQLPNARFATIRRAWQSADAIQVSRSNIPHHCETAGPHNCRLVVDLRSVRHDQSGGSGTIRGFL